MEVMFARHGNTFAPGEPAVWVGRETDLPPVARGVEQAHEAAEALRRMGWQPGRIVAASLCRTREFAATVAADLGLAAPVVDSRLDEVHYGRWAGRTSEDIATEPGGAEALRGWSEADQWPPEAAGWVSRQEDIFAALKAFIASEIKSAAAPEKVLVVSSNGILRFLPRLLGALADAGRGSYVMKTGHLGLLGAQDGEWRIRFWNRAPRDLPL